MPVSVGDVGCDVGWSSFIYLLNLSNGIGAHHVTGNYMYIASAGSIQNIVHHAMKGMSSLLGTEATLKLSSANPHVTITKVYARTHQELVHGIQVCVPPRSRVCACTRPCTLCVPLCSVSVSAPTCVCCVCVFLSLHFCVSEIANPCNCIVSWPTVSHVMTVVTAKRPAKRR